MGVADDAVRLTQTFAATVVAALAALLAAVRQRLRLGPVPQAKSATRFADTEQRAIEDEAAVRRGVPAKVDGRVLEADMVHLDAGVASRKVFIFFPGNPGLVDFYLTMLREIFRRNKGSVHVVAIGHAGHSAWTPGDHQPIGYQAQIQHKVQVLRQEISWFEDADAQVMIAGHSVGARVGLEVMHALPAVKWVRYIGICPTVMYIGQSPNGTKLSPLLANSWLRTLAYLVLHPVSALVMLLPFGVKHAVVKSIMRKDCPGVDDHFVGHGLKLVHPTVVQNVLHMANDEMQEILDVTHFQDTILNPHMSKMTFVLSPIDRWCHHEIVERMRKAFVGAHFHVLPDSVTHAFCLSHENINLVVDAVQTALGRDDGASPSSS
ncbi:Lipid droplet-associated hydrolase [Hondaea fermentalgiana]|uniref:Lipid droplet-associated hydrolase n=1 Tax=Hondaea fermentalgiana TaxID=2315210 RepID=A0A2R5GCV6_9STRA|nr:Lipid droplet-associated hydrolase [Hondaea fermentalgiana]|eukprot:GBG25604.1 Lipid droplet-associated hydrolase [Hondaea fermentalgiana]